MSAGSVSGGGVVATVATVVGTGVGTVVAGGTGVGDEQPAARIPTNRTAQTKNSKDFIFTEYHHLLFIPILTFSFRAGTWIISHEISILTVNQEKKWIRNSNCLHQAPQFC
jgi:hypothetical protein